ncbi:MAG: trypsin-like peptidase domain-containing protein [Candidatus Peribacteria bacterium]|nr:MAG: trypsin-like peptidase domain-containing protein [Candidatus Peribacteria bacterium]
MFSEYSQGSAVALGQNLLVTNAHVVMDDDRTIMQNIAVCVITGLVIDPPECSVVASVLAIDINKDIAILQTKYPVGALVPVTIADDDMELGESVAVLGYPANGGSTITYTE